MFWRKNKNPKRNIRVIQLSTLNRSGVNQMGLFKNRRQRQAEAAAEQSSVEQSVIAYVSAMPEEEYKKLLKKFTAHRELQRKLQAIEDGDINDALNEPGENMHFEETPTPQPRKIEVQDGTGSASESSNNT